MDASLMAEMKTMTEENRHLKKMYAKMAMQNELLKDALGKKLEAVSASGGHACTPSAGCKLCACLPDIPDQRKLLLKWPFPFQHFGLSARWSGSSNGGASR